MERGISGAVFLTLDDRNAVIIGTVADGQNSEGFGLTFQLDGNDVHHLDDVNLFGNAALMLGGQAVATFSDGGIRLRTLTGDSIETFPDDVEGQCMASFNDILLAVGSGDGFLWIWALDSKRILAAVETSSARQQIYALAWHPSGDWLVTTSQGDGVRLWSVSKLQATPADGTATPDATHVIGENRMYYEPVFSADGTLLAVGCGTGEVLLFDVAPGELRLRHTLKNSDNEVMAQAFHPTQPHLVTDANGTLCVWDTNTGALVMTRETIAWFEPEDENDEDDEDDDDLYEEFSPTQIAGIRFARGGKLLVVARAYHVELWDLP